MFYSTTYMFPILIKIMFDPDELEELTDQPTLVDS